MTAIDVERPALDTSALLGTWRNTNTESRGITRIEVAPHGRDLAVTVTGSESWGSVIANPFSIDGFHAIEALAFQAVFDLGFIEVRLQANIKAGVLVVAALTQFRDATGRQHYFAREFYYRSAP
jgi:hypothetical protein